MKKLCAVIPDDLINEIQSFSNQLISIFQEQLQQEKIHFFIPSKIRSILQFRQLNSSILSFSKKRLEVK